MPRLLVLVAVFLISFVAYGVWSAPAVLVVSRLAPVELAGSPLRLTQARGRVWDGAATWHWQGLRGQLRWEFAWHGLTPGVQVDLVGSGISAHGWLGGSPGHWQLRGWQLALPVDLIAQQLAFGDASGRLTGQIQKLTWSEGRVTALVGELHWTGGRVSWPPNGHAQIPPLQGRLFQRDSAAWLKVTSPRGQLLADARLREGTLRLRVYQAWPMLLGVIEQGQPSSVVVKIQRTLFSRGGGHG